jgi:tetratricopeptide (TPR) repeat protein
MTAKQLLDHAQDAYDAEDDAAALKLANRAVAADPKLGAAWALVGYCELARDRPTPALAALDRAAKLAPKLADVQRARATALAALGNTRGVLAALLLGAKHAPRDPALLEELGDALRDARRWTDAEAIYARFAKLDGGAYGWWARGVCLIELRRYADALASAKRALAAEPAYSQAETMVCHLLVFHLDKPREALRWFRTRAGERFHHDLDWQFWRGVAHYRLDELAEAGPLLLASNTREDCIMWQSEQALLYRVRIAVRGDDMTEARRLMARLRDLTMDDAELATEIKRDPLLERAARRG